MSETEKGSDQAGEVQPQLPAPESAPATPPVAPQPFAPPPAAAAPGTWWAPPPPPTPAAQTNDSVWHRIAAAVVLAAVVAAAGGIGIGWSLARVVANHNTANQGQPITAVNPGSGSGSQNTGNLNAAAIAAKVDPAIVDINTVTASGQGAGTGMILTSSGEVLTNNHVVDGATSLQVTIAGRSGTYVADVVGVDPTADVALIQVEGVSGLPTVTLASSSSLQVGQSVVALGNALGAGGTPNETQGSITALDQSITASEGRGVTEQLTGLIQSDAAISPGDSGGALVNSAGQVIGMITAGQTQGFRTTVSTVGYAVPSDVALTVVNQIRSGQSSSEVIIGAVGYIGVSVRDLDSATAAQLGLSVSTGALVIGVQTGSPAASAGINQYSVITSVAGSAVTSTATLGTAIHAHKPGERISVTWVNQTGTHTATLTLESGPAI
jgi:S1-C subfamily serine protease